MKNNSNIAWSKGRLTSRQLSAYDDFQPQIKKIIYTFQSSLYF